MSENSRQFAFQALQRINKGAFADIALDQVLQKSNLDQRDRRLVTELVYGSIRQQRTLDAWIAQLSQKKKTRHPVNLQLILRLGFYQLCFLNQIPPSAAVNTTVNLAKSNGFKGLAGFVNGILRQYLRLRDQQDEEQATVPSSHRPNGPIHKVEQEHPISPHRSLQLPNSDIEQLGVLYSYPDWIVTTWLNQLNLEETTQLCQWFNRPPSIDLRVNPQRTTIEIVETALQAIGLTCKRVSNLPYTLRFVDSPGLIQALPGFQEGWWTVQDASAQLVSYLLDPQPHEIIIDTCAAPGGKTTHIGELMGDTGTIWACDRNASRLRKVTENSDRLQLQSISIQPRDCTLSSEELRLQSPQKTVDDVERSLDSDWDEYADRVLVDAPCSGLGTLHRHADARWRQSEDTVSKLSKTQFKLLQQASQWVKSGGVLVYSTCTLHPLENESVVMAFLKENPSWTIEAPTENRLLVPLLCSEGWMKVWPHRQDMDGFFMVKLRKQ